MTQFYTDPTREQCPTALPDAETLVISGSWYWWSCLPGCLPDSGPMGPFDTEEEAIADAREWNQ